MRFLNDLNYPKGFYRPFFVDQNMKNVKIQQMILERCLEKLSAAADFRQMNTIE